MKRSLLALTVLFALAAVSAPNSAYAQ